jgi:hypothetical protein
VYSRLHRQTIHQRYWKLGIAMIFWQEHLSTGVLPEGARDAPTHSLLAPGRSEIEKGKKKTKKNVL